MHDEGMYGPYLRNTGVTLHLLNMPRSRITLRGLYKLFRILRKEKPDLVQTWMYHSNLVGGIIAKLAGVHTVIWSIHNANLDPDKNRLSTRLVSSLCAILSPFLSNATVFVSKKSMEIHQKAGYKSRLNIVISNAVDINDFQPNEHQGNTLRKEWKIEPNMFLLGFVARWDPYKDHKNLLQALSLIKNQFNYRCVLVGFGIDNQNKSLMNLIETYQMQQHVVLASQRNDIPAIMNSLDLHILSSAGEAFGNVLIEAMACGIPCVSTDVGAASLIIGNTGWIVPPQDSLSLSKGIKEALTTIRNIGRTPLQKNCRSRIVELFTVEKMFESYNELWDLVLKTH